MKISINVFIQQLLFILQFLVVILSLWTLRFNWWNWRVCIGFECNAMQMQFRMFIYVSELKCSIETAGLQISQKQKTDQIKHLLIAFSQQFLLGLNLVTPWIADRYIHMLCIQEQLHTNASVFCPPPPKISCQLYIKNKFSLPNQGLHTPRVALRLLLLDLHINVYFMPFYSPFLPCNPVSVSFPLIKHVFSPHVCWQVKLDWLAVAWLLNALFLFAPLSQITSQRLEWQCSAVQLIHFPMMLIEKVIFCPSVLISQLGIWGSDGTKTVIRSRIKIKPCGLGFISEVWWGNTPC